MNNKFKQYVHKLIPNQIELNVLDKINTMRNDARYIRNKQILNEHNISASDYELYVISKKMELTPDILRELIHE